MKDLSEMKEGSILEHDHHADMTVFKIDKDLMIYIKNKYISYRKTVEGLISDGFRMKEHE